MYLSYHLTDLISLQWRHNRHHSVSNHQPHGFYATVYSDADQRKHQSSASLAFVWGIHRAPVNSPHKWPVTRKMFPFDDVIMCIGIVSMHFLIALALHFRSQNQAVAIKEPDPSFKFWQQGEFIWGEWEQWLHLFTWRFGSTYQTSTTRSPRWRGGCVSGDRIDICRQKGTREAQVSDDGTRQPVRKHLCAMDTQDQEGYRK